MSDKEQCFKDAIGKYEDVSGKDLGIKFEQQWVKDLNGTWSQVTEGPIQKLFNSIAKTLGILSGDVDPRADGAANPIQLRRPDMTIDDSIVVDNKFTGANGKPDPWRTGGQSGSDQRPDYNDINKQNGNQGQDLSLNKDVCKCGGAKQPQESLAPQPNPLLAPLPDFNPLGLPMPEPVPVPGPFPLPEPVPIPGGFPAADPLPGPLGFPAADPLPVSGPLPIPEPLPIGVPVEVPVQVPVRVPIRVPIRIPIFEPILP